MFAKEMSLAARQLAERRGPHTRITARSNAIRTMIRITIHHPDFVSVSYVSVWIVK